MQLHPRSDAFEFLNWCLGGTEYEDEGAIEHCSYPSHLILTKLLHKFCVI